MIERRCVLLLTALIACRTGAAARPSTDSTHEISAADIRARISIVAADSMEGREAGEEGNWVMTSYLAKELARIGVEPAGENGTFFQTIPMVRRRADLTSTLRVGADTLQIFTDFAPVRPGPSLRSGTSLVVGEAGTVYGGRAGDATVVLTPEQVRGKIVVLDAPLGADSLPTGVYGVPTGRALSQFPAAAAVAVAALDLITPEARATLRARGNGLSGVADSAPLAMLISRAATERLMGAPLPSLKVGAAGRPVSGRVGFIDEPVAISARNVIGVIRGSDPALRGQYVAIGAHSDHLRNEPRAVDHDSLRAFNKVLRPEGRNRAARAPTRQDWVRIRALLDSFRRLSPPRPDSINNGADDDASGSVAALEIAESIARGARPRRSILFVWHTAEEGGLLGSFWFVDNPTVSRDSIVAQLNMDMVGRGPDSLRGVSPLTIQVIGSRRLSTELGDLVESVNRARRNPFRIDYSFDAAGHPLNRYCRSDHYNYARRGIPITYFSRGYHDAYHMVTDEAQYLDLEGIAEVSAFVRDVALAIANRPARLSVDGPRMNPRAPCRQ